jgi:M6 family metalloprotease-like protein
LSIQSTVVGWIDVPKTEAFYANGQSGLTTRIWQALKSPLDPADAVIDFRDFDEDNNGYIDSIAFIHSGYGTEWGGIDVLFGSRYLLEQRELAPDELLRGDVAPVIDGISTPDGQFTAGDQLLILQKALGQPAAF